MTPSESLKARIEEADAAVEVHYVELLRRCRQIADDGDEGMAYALFNLDAAKRMAAGLRETMADLRNGKPKTRSTRKRRKPTPKKRPGPSIAKVQGEALDAVAPGHQILARELFAWCQAKYPALFPASRYNSFTSTLSKTLKGRDDVTLMRKSEGSNPAIYMKLGASVSPNP